MERATCRQAVAARAAAAVLALVAVSPLQAQERASAANASPTLVASLNAVEMPAGGNISRGKLPGVELCLVGDGDAARPACVILHLQRKADAGGSPAEAEELAQRFVSAYKLTGYRQLTAADRSTVLLLREDDTRPWRYKGQQALMALADSSSPAPAIRWLTDAFGSAPHMEGEHLIWHHRRGRNRTRCELEASLSLHGSLPCRVDIRLRGVNVGQADELLSEQLQLPLKPPSHDKGLALRNRLGAKPLAIMEGHAMQHGQRQQVTLCLMRTGKDNGAYRLADIATLQKLREGGEAEMTVPQVGEATWADELPAPEPARPVVDEETPQEAAPPAAPAMPTPAEARQAYSQRLRSL